MHLNGFINPKEVFLIDQNNTGVPYTRTDSFFTGDFLKKLGCACLVRLTATAKENWLIETQPKPPKNMR